MARVRGVATLDRSLDDVDAIEEAFVAQWAHFGQGPGGSVHIEDGLTWIEAPVRQLPYNGVLRTHLDGDVDAKIDATIERFVQRGVQFLWLVHPTAAPADLEARLVARGLSLVERGTGMALDLASWRPAPASPSPVSYRRVTDDETLRAYEDLIVAYWELADYARDYVFAINRATHAAGVDGERQVAFLDGRPVGKGYLSYVGQPGTAAIFAIYVDPTARGHGVASGITSALLTRAAELGFERVVLHSSEMAVSLYRRMGFIERCSLPVYATAPLHSVQPS